MPWSAGAYSRLYGSAGWVDDRDAGTKILATRHDAHDQDLADGISAAMAKDGSNAATADLNIGGFKLTNVADPTSAQHAATKAYVDAAGSIAFASGDQLIWRGASTPTGWTVAAQNNKALRLTSGTPGSGGSIAFTSLFAASYVTVAEAAHTHSVSTGNTSTGATVAAGTGGNFATADHSHTATTGAGSAHAHTVNLAVQYYDMQVIQKT
jgi:hypothetical protein